jgi:hypothetical protein
MIILKPMNSCTTHLPISIANLSLNYFKDSSNYKWLIEADESLNPSD